MSDLELAESPHKGQRGLRRLFNAFLYSLSGLRLAFHHESAFRQEVALAAIDRIGLDTHRLSKRAKDLGSAAVLIALIVLALVWTLLAGPALVRMSGLLVGHA